MEQKKLAKDKVITKAFVITGGIFDIIQNLSQSKGLNNDSAALRLIINEWAEMRKEYITVPVIGKVK